MGTKPVAEMNLDELSAHIKEKEEDHRREMKHLRALARILGDQESNAKK